MSLEMRHIQQGREGSATSLQLAAALVSERKPHHGGNNEGATRESAAGSKVGKGSGLSIRSSQTGTWQTPSASASGPVSQGGISAE